MIADYQYPNPRSVSLIYSVVDQIIDRVAFYYHVEPRRLRGPCRLASVIRPRHVAMYLAREMTPCSLDEIGEHLGGRNHTTVLHGWRRMRYEMEQDTETAKQIRVLMNEFIGTTA